MNLSKCKIVVCLALSGFLLTSCSVGTEPTTLGERSARAAVDRAALFGGQEDIIKPITLYEAIARAVKYNSNQRVTLMEQALAYNIADSATMDLLPQIAASGGFVGRSDEFALSAKSVETGLETLPDSYIQDRNVGGAQLDLVYNILDFGISYVNAKQSSDKRFISEEVRRKSMQHVVHDVRVTFWKAAAAQRVSQDMQTMIAAVQDELVRVNIGDKNQKTVAQLKEEKELLTALQTLMDLRNDILTAKAELGTLMNLPPNTDFVLDIPSDMDTPQIVTDFGQIDLEQFALVNRPELRISDYEARIASMQAKKELLRMFPGIELSVGVNYDSNSYLQNQTWADAGVGLTWNIMRLFSQPKAIEIAKTKEELERLRRISMTMAVLSQVNISYLQLRQNAETFSVVESLDTVNDKLWQKIFVDNTKTVQERRKALITAINRLVSHLERDFAYAAYKDAESNLFIALGVDPLPRFIPEATIHAIAETLEDNLSRNAPRGFKEVSYDRAPSDKARLTALSGEQRAKILEWTGLRRMDTKPKANAPVAHKIPVVKVTNAKASSTKKGLLQLSSFEKLGRAQLYWQELVAAEPSLAKYAPIYREVNIPNIGTRFRTLITDTHANLRATCQRLAVELKSCLIYNE